MVIDGKQIAEEIYTEIGTKLSGKTLGILVGEKNPVIDSFVKIKGRAAERLGVELVREELPEGAATADAAAAVQSLAQKTDGIIVQLPLPSHIDVETVLAALPPEKDVDGISPNPKVRPPVAGAIEEILMRSGAQVHDSSSVVVGSGRLVGKPAATLLEDLDAHVTVIQKGDSLDPLKAADIVILGAGEPGLIKPEHLKEGVILIDAGTSEVSGKIAGDADPACAAKASLFTPVPGGVGPIAVATIFKNIHFLV